jgi:DnaJ-class molecular chaperone
MTSLDINKLFIDKNIENSEGQQLRTKRRISMVCSFTYQLKIIDLLGVSKGSNKDDIKKAYFKLAKVYHPDVNKTPEAQEKFASINEYVFRQSIF